MSVVKFIICFRVLDILKRTLMLIVPVTHVGPRFFTYQKMVKVLEAPKDRRLEYHRGPSIQSRTKAWKNSKNQKRPKYHNLVPSPLFIFTIKIRLYYKTSNKP